MREREDVINSDWKKSKKKESQYNGQQNRHGDHQ